MVHVHDHYLQCLARLDPDSSYMSRNLIQKTVGLNRIVLSREHRLMENYILFCHQQWPLIWTFAVAFSHTKLINLIIFALHPWAGNTLNPQTGTWGQIWPQPSLFFDNVFGVCYNEPLWICHDKCPLGRHSGFVLLVITVFLKFPFSLPGVRFDPRWPCAFFCI